MPRINHLKIRKFGNVAPGTELTFDPRGVVLLGRNGTGKTTLLNILASILRCDFSSLSIEDYDVEFSLTCASDVELQVAARCEQAHVAPLPNLAPQAVSDAVLSSLQHRARRRMLRIEVLDPQADGRTLIESDDSKIQYTYSDGRVIINPASADEDWVLLGLGASEDRLRPLLWSAIFELVSLSNNLRRFDEGLDYFRDLTERRSSAARIEALQQYDYYIANPTRTRLIPAKCAYFLLEDFKRNEERSTSGFSDSAQLQYLDTFCRLAGFQRARIGAELDEKRQTRDGVVVSFGPLRFSVERDGAILHHDHLSFGQKRLLTFLHYHDSTPDLVIADELVNGMHHEWIAECLRLMQNSQAFLSSQNPLLFDFLTFESPEEVANRFVICDLDEQHRFVWRNMSESDAVEFYEIYKTELQHVSAILRTRGYW